MGTTSRGYPYPEPTDPVSQGAAAIQALANAVNTRAGSAAAGTVQITGSNSALGFATVTFPANRFNAVPFVTGSANSGFWIVFRSGGASATAATIGIRYNTNASQGTISQQVDWIAIQI